MEVRSPLLSCTYFEHYCTKTEIYLIFFSCLPISYLLLVNCLDPSLVSKGKLHSKDLPFLILFFSFSLSLLPSLLLFLSFFLSTFLSFLFGIVFRKLCVLNWFQRDLMNTIAGCTCWVRREEKWICICQRYGAVKSPLIATQQKLMIPRSKSYCFFL